MNVLTSIDAAIHRAKQSAIRARGAYTNSIAPAASKQREQQGETMLKTQRIVDDLESTREAIVDAVGDLLMVSTEMRERKVNHGKTTSPTLIAWADRVDKAAGKIIGEAP